MNRLTVATFIPGAGVTAFLVFASSGAPEAGLVFAALLAGVVGLIALGTERPAVWILYGALLTAPMESVRPAPGSLLTLSDLLLGVGMVLLLPTLVRRPLHIPTPMLVAFSLIIPTLAIASLANPDSGQLLINGARLLLAVVVVPVALLWWRPGLSTLVTLAWAYVIGHVLSTMAALAEGDLGNNRWDGLTTHPNYFGHCGVIAFCLLIFLQQHHRRAQPLLWLPALVCAASIAMSGSRASALVAVMIVLLYPVVERSVMAAYLLMAGVLAGIVASNRIADWLNNPSLDFLARFTGDETTEFSDRERTQVLSDALERFLDQPLLGHGFDAEGLSAHNIYLQVAVGLGIFGLVGFLLVVVTAVRTLTQTGDLYRLGYLALAYAGLGMLTNSLWDRFIWLPMAMALVAYSRASSPQPAAEASSTSNLSATSASANSRSASFRAR